ncbi:class I SAM-dependent methyltransferase [Citricoccus parietis]|uniref:Class I SAM-dependent methyltransferase n=1 Tax=Citricoccus parietis TaxID=592307 RepID=A0ABV6F1F3_9MICC
MRITARRILPVILGVVAAFLLALVLTVAGYAGAEAVTAGAFWTTLATLMLLMLVLGAILAVLALSLVRLVLRSAKVRKWLRRQIDRFLDYVEKDSQRRQAAKAQVLSARRQETTTRERLEAAERRLLATMDTFRFGHEDRLAALEERLEAVDEHMERQASKAERQRSDGVRHTTTTSRETVRQVESLMQLSGRVDSSHHRLPLSGGFAMNAEGLLWLTDLLQDHQPRKVLEVGSGASTSWMGEFVRRHGGKIVSVDHLEEYAAQTRHEVEARGLGDTVEVRLSPLQPVDIKDQTFQWYGLEAFHDLRDIDLLVVDGPPKSTGENARFPALPVLLDRLAPGCLVVMDDFNRPDERAIVEGWLDQFPQFEPVETFNERIGMIRRVV